MSALVMWLSTVLLYKLDRCINTLMSIYSALEAHRLLNLSHTYTLLEYTVKLIANYWLTTGICDL